MILEELIETKITHEHISEGVMSFVKGLFKDDKEKQYYTFSFGGDWSDKAKGKKAIDALLKKYNGKYLKQKDSDTSFDYLLGFEDRTNAEKFRTTVA